MCLGPESRAVSLWTSEFMREGSQDLDSKAKLGIISIKPFSEFGQPGPHRDWYDHHNNSHHGMDDHHGLTMAHRPQSHLPAPPCESPAGGDSPGLPTCGTQTPGGSQHQPSPFHWMKGEWRESLDEPRVCGYLDHIFQMFSRNQSIDGEDARMSPHSSFWAAPPIHSEHGTSTIADSPNFQDRHGFPGLIQKVYLNIFLQS